MGSGGRCWPTRQGTSPRLHSINTLANTMKHCINVSNYWQEGRKGGGGGLGDERGSNKDVPPAVNHSNRCGRQTANQNNSSEMRPSEEILHTALFRQRSKRRSRGERKRLSQYRKLTSQDDGLSNRCCHDLCHHPQHG